MEYLTNLNRLIWVWSVVLLTMTDGLLAQDDCLIYTDRSVYFPGDKLCIRVIWPGETGVVYLQVSAPNTVDTIRQILDFEGSRFYDNCLDLPQELSAGNYNLTVTDNSGLGLSTAFLVYGPGYTDLGDFESVQWADAPNLNTGKLTGPLVRGLITGPGKEKEIKLDILKGLDNFHVCITDARFSALSGSWMSKEQLKISEEPAIMIRGKLDLGDHKPPLLLANFSGEVGYFSGTTVQRDGTFELNDLDIKGPTRMRLFLPDDLKGMKIQFRQFFPEISGQSFSRILLPKVLKQEFDLYYKLTVNYPSPLYQEIIPDNDLFTTVRRSYMINEYLPLPTVEEIIGDIVVGVKVVKENGTPVDVRINDDALLAMDETVSPLVFVNDNLLSDNSKIFLLPVESVSRIAVIPSVESRDIFGYIGIGGAMSIELTQEVPWMQPDAEGHLNGTLLKSGLTVPEAGPNTPDYRSTLVWRGQNKDKSGVISFTATDFSGNYLIKLSGTDASGKVLYYEETFPLSIE